MSKILITALFICFASACFAQDTTATAKNNKPIAVYQVGNAKVAVWEHQNPDGGAWKSFKVEKNYKKDDQWVTENYFNSEELLQLKAAIDKAIMEEVVKVRQPK